ncbi:hypothetical protein B566_EDAN006072 [Ephemera danica]|nr:hypothetical protein B566_EDAN006072 [Ephemera danica]
MCCAGCRAPRRPGGCRGAAVAERPATSSSLQLLHSSRYFDCDYEQTENTKQDGGLGATTPMFISEVMGEPLLQPLDGNQSWNYGRAASEEVSLRCFHLAQLQVGKNNPKRRYEGCTRVEMPHSTPSAQAAGAEPTSRLRARGEAVLPLTSATASPAPEHATSTGPMPKSPPPTYEAVLEENRMAQMARASSLETAPTSSTMEKPPPRPSTAPPPSTSSMQIQHKSSKQLYRAVAAQWGLTCKMSDKCRCLDCQREDVDSDDTGAGEAGRVRGALEQTARDRVSEHVVQQCRGASGQVSWSLILIWIAVESRQRQLSLMRHERPQSAAASRYSSVLERRLAGLALDARRLPSPPLSVFSVPGATCKTNGSFYHQHI